jgi:DNA-binding NtrC family response regulator
MTNTKNTTTPRPQRAAAPASAAPLFVGQSTTGAGAARPERDDFVEGVLDLVCAIKPMTEEERSAAAQAVRRHYGSEKHYVAARGPDADADAVARKVLSRLNGRNARTIARELGIGKSTVYRKIKQHGGREA